MREDPPLAPGPQPASAEDVRGNALQLMRGGQDEAKFAGLLLLAKHLSSSTTTPRSKDNNEDVRRRVLDAVTPQFLARLLASPASSPNSPHFRGVALAVLTTLAQDPTLLPRLRPLLKHVLNVLDDTTTLLRKEGEEEGEARVKLLDGTTALLREEGKEEGEARVKVVEDCLFFVYALTQHDRSVAFVQALGTHEAFRRVVSCMMELREMKSSSSSSSSSNIKSGVEEEEGMEAAAVAAAAVGMEMVSEEEEGSIADATLTPTNSSSNDTKDATPTPPTTTTIPPAATTTAAAAAPPIHPSTRLLTEACATLHEILLLQNDLQYPQPFLSDSDNDKGVTLVMLSFLLEEEAGDIKLRILHLLNLLLSHLRCSSHQAAVAATAAPPTAAVPVAGKTYMTRTNLKHFGKHMRGALLQLLHGALREPNRDPALALLVHMLALFGQSWAIEDEAEDEGGREGGKEGGVLFTKPRAEGGREEGGLFTKPRAEGGREGGGGGMRRGTCAGFFVHALSAETRMAAEELESLADVGEEVMESDLSLKKRLGRAKEVLPLCVDGLDAVLRFLCGAGDGPECLQQRQQQKEEKGEEKKEWVMLPGKTLLEMRASLHDAVGALLKLLQDGGREWKQQQQQQGGREGEGGREEGMEMEEVYREAVRFLSAVLAEDEACMVGEEALGVLPFVMYLGGGGGEGGRGGGGVGWVLPWVSRVLSPGTAEEEGEEEGVTAVLRLVDECQIHLWFVEHLMQPLFSSGGGGEKQQIDLLLLFHEILLKGGDSVLCDDHACLLAYHPQVLNLVPHLMLAPSSLPSSFSSIRLCLYQVWFVLSLLWGRAGSSSSSSSRKGRKVQKRKGEKEEEDAYAREVLERVLPVGSKEYLAWVEGVGEVLIEGMKAIQQAAVVEEGEKREELEGLWGQSVHLLSLAPDDLRRDIFGALGSRYGEREVQALQEELLLVGAASAVLS